MHKRRASTFFSHLMCSHESRYFVSKMGSVATLIFFLFLFFATTAEGEMKKSLDKIIIHIPYKIHKHHHTHTKYKVITIPAPKEEKKVIYFKEHIQPIIKEVPVLHTQIEITESQPNLPKAPEVIIPPHQESAQSFLESTSHPNNHNLAHSDQHKEFHIISGDQKSLETHSTHNLQNFVPNLPYKPLTLPLQANFIHDFSFKPVALSSHHAFTPRFFPSTDIHQFYQNLVPRFSYLPQHHLHSPNKVKPLLSKTKTLQDSVAHTSSQVYRTIIPTPKASAYQVKEEIQEGKPVQLVKHQHPLNAIPVPSGKPKRKGKTSAQMNNFNNKYQSDADYEYEHVGYLIIDGNSRKLVGKNFKDELVLSR